MTVPNYQTICALLLGVADDRQNHLLREDGDNLANYFNLTEEQKELLHENIKL